MISIEKIKQLYPSLQKWSDSYAEGIYMRILNEQLIKEFLYTTDSEKLYRFISKQFGDNIMVDLENKTHIHITFRVPIEEFLTPVNNYMEKHGWFPSFIPRWGKYSTTISKVFGIKNITITYEGKYDKEVEVDRYLYHLTPDVLYPHIKLSGLTPKSKSSISNHPERIYLLNSSTMDEYEDIAIKLWEELNVPQLKDAIGDYYLLQIDTSKLSKHKFFNDPNFYMGNGAVWTYQNISPLYISVIKLITVNPKPIVPINYEVADKRRNQFKENFNKINKIL